MKDISPKEMVEWFKTKAEEFNRIAKDLETTFSTSGQPLVQIIRTTVITPTTVDMVRESLVKIGKPARHSMIADALKASGVTVKNILKNNPDKFEQVGRGWWKVKD